MIWMNIPTPIRIPMTGSTELTDSFAILATLKRFPVKHPTAALMRNTSGMPISGIEGTALLMTISTIARTSGI